MLVKCSVVILVTILRMTLQDCPQETSKNGFKVEWPASPANTTAKSRPTCYHRDDESIILRTCNDTTWSPSLDKLEPCLKTTPKFDVDSCPPGYHKISPNNSRLCYQISEPSVWDYPCGKSGGAPVITDLNAEEVNSLVDALAATGISKYFFLAAKRQKLFNPLTWYIPGPFWGMQVESKSKALPLESNFLKNCLAIDVEERILTTKTCNTNSFPSLCLYLNELNNAAKCPDGYFSFRFMPDDSACFGLEQSSTSVGMTYNDFLLTKCNEPMGNNDQVNLARYVYKYTKMANSSEFPENKWCWFGRPTETYNVTKYSDKTEENSHTEVLFAYAINSHGMLTIMGTQNKLSCMTCKKEMIYKESDVSLEYNPQENKMFLSVYYPSSLWKYNNDDRGIRCFSNAKGFVVQVEIDEEPYINDTKSISRTDDDDDDIEKIVYIIDLISDRTAQYWCEGHSKNFSLISTNQIIAKPRGNNEHVFALVIKSHFENATQAHNFAYFSEITDTLSEVLSAGNFLLMDILEITNNYIAMLFHIHIAVKRNDEDIENVDLTEIFNNLKANASVELFKQNMSLVNISSSIFCLPTTSQDIVTLDWELTLINHVVAPVQFCLQANGLPVRRRCLGSYLLGGYWGPVEGRCDKNYQPSNATTFLYNFIKEKNDTTHFLSSGLQFVLNDVNIIIPADIYYLAMCLNYVSHVVQENETALKMSNLDEFAWAVDRLMLLDLNYLSLAQTLNSTNILLDSVTEIIQVFSTQNRSSIKLFNSAYRNSYQISVKSNFVIQISYPYLNNISGIALIRNGSSDLFNNMIIIPLYMNSTYDELLSIKNIEIAAWVPEKVLRTLKPHNTSFSGNSSMSQDDVHINIQVFYNDAVFQELGKPEHIVDSRIIEISIPGFVPNLDKSIPLIFRNNRAKGAVSKFCGYWDFKAKTSSIPGKWSKRGCFFTSSKNNLSVCECYHLTHFANLIMIGQDKKSNSLEESHRKALNIITITGASMSLIGIIGIWVTALTFTPWRQKTGTKVLLQLSTAIALPLIFIIYFNMDGSIFVDLEGNFKVNDNRRVLCIALGASLHYSILAGFVWMLITAVLQFIRYVRVLGVSRPARFMIKLSVIGWGIPVFPVSALLIIDKDNYIPFPIMTKGTDTGLCYPHGLALILSVLLPIGVILIVNITLFLLVIFAISRGPDGKMRATDLDLVKSQLRLSILLFFLLGLTWVFGIFSFSRNVWWSYLFCLTSTPQGFVLFVYFVICDPATRNMWITLMKPQFRMRSSRDSISCSNSTFS